MIVQCSRSGCEALAASEGVARLQGWTRNPRTGQPLCSKSCLDLVSGNLASRSLDFGNPADRARMEAANAGARSVGTMLAPDVVVACAGGIACGTSRSFPATSTRAQIDRALDAENWTKGPPRYCGINCSRTNAPRPPPPPAPEPLSEDDEELRALLAHRLCGIRPMNALGAARYDRQEKFVRACVVRRESAKTALERLGRDRVLAELRGDRDQPRQTEGD